MDNFKSLWLKTKHSFPFFFLFEKGLVTRILPTAAVRPSPRFRLSKVVHRHFFPPHKTTKLLFRSFHSAGNTGPLHHHDLSHSFLSFRSIILHLVFYCVLFPSCLLGNLRGGRFLFYGSYPGGKRSGLRLSNKGLGKFLVD
jgi:hypothetical protein